tara:strand:+ start:9466 stop:9783 length:318 start_codon:yes stop_codon:yes gene_type:complete
MPKVGRGRNVKNFPYTQKGKRDARRYARATGQPVRGDSGYGRPKGYTSQRAGASRFAPMGQRPQGPKPMGPRRGRMRGGPATSPLRSRMPRTSGFVPGIRRRRGK